VIGGMGSAVCEVLAENYPAKVKRWGLLDKFGESGSPEALYKKYELDAEGIARRLTEFMKG
jgi:transketolase